MNDEISKRIPCNLHVLKLKIQMEEVLFLINRFTVRGLVCSLERVIPCETGVTGYRDTEKNPLPAGCPEGG